MTLRQLLFLRREFELSGWPKGTTTVYINRRGYVLYDHEIQHIVNMSESVIDRYIRRYGPLADWRMLFNDLKQQQQQSTATEAPEQQRLEGESRPKGTDAVADVSAAADTSQCHGGDGNSGEVAAPAMTRSQDDRSGNQERNSDGHDCISGDASDMQSAVDRNPNEAWMPECGGDCVSDASPQHGDDDMNGADAMTHSTEPSSSTAPDGGASASNAAQIGDDAPHSITDAAMHSESVDGGVTVTPSFHDQLDDGDAASMLTSLASRNTWGGWHIDRARVYALAARLRPDAVRLASAIRRWIADLDLGGDETSPRWDGRRLIVEMVTRRWSLSRARRRECDVPLVLLLTDVSGSCSAVCHDTTAACLAVADQLPNAVVIEHSNGYVYVSDDDTITICEWLDRYHRGRRIGGVIAFGDWDAAHQYEQLVRIGAKMAWLDSYGATHGPRPASRRFRAAAGNWAAAVSPWWVGVQTAAQAAIALQSRQ